MGGGEAAAAASIAAAAGRLKTEGCMANATDAAMWHGFKTLVLLDSFIVLIRVAHPTHNTPPPLPPDHPCVLSDILLMYFGY